MPDLPILTGPRLVLRAPLPEDAAGRLALGRDAEVLAGYGVELDELPPLTREGAEAWVAEKTQGTSWLMFHDGALTGSISLRDIHSRDLTASLSVGLLSADRMGRGFGREAISLVLAYAFGTLGLHRVSLRVMATNARAIRCYAACGFVEEGREREGAWTPSGRVDDLIMGLLARERAA